MSLMDRNIYPGCTVPTQTTTARLVIALVSRIQKRYWGQEFCKKERDISVLSGRNVQTGLALPSQVNPTELNCNRLFHLISSEFGVEWEAPLVSTFILKRFKTPLIFKLLKNSEFYLLNNNNRTPRKQQIF